jgi:two-component system, OmpR family, sensor kinase
VSLRSKLRTPRLRTQLVALLLALLTVAFALVAVVTAVELSRFLADRLDQQLQSAGGRYAATLEHSPDGDRDADDDRQFDVAGQAAGTLGARSVDGRVTAAHVVGHDADDGSEPGAAARAVLGRLTAARAPRTVDLPGLGKYRVLTQRGSDGDLLITGLPLHPVEETTHRLIRIEAVVFGITFVAVGLSGAFFVRLSLRPLNRVAATASRVADLPLSSGTVELAERAPVSAPGTEVGQLADAFNHMLEHVEASLRRRQESEDRLRHFLADASHELRTPVAVVRSHAELARRTGGDLPPEVAHSLERIGAESERMGHLVEDLLTLARLDSGRPLAREEVDLTRLLLDAVSDARVAAPDHRWKLDLPEEPITVIGDEHALHQVIANLLANARTHTPAGTTVRATLRPARSDVGIEIADDGPGIPADVLPGIFERFVRADDARSASTGSSGLGLAIVRAIVRGHGGTVAADSRPGATSFHVRLPAGGAQPSPSE